ncbi:hypothetical protein SLS60_007155 [Paraconiothyrium brasiliense]|uniref:Uncharacterized protein n=1 Tax=Paraconiothyrium brasiliense TaxID=300254 RepID=A0ABR3R8S6_9PLEO
MKLAFAAVIVALASVADFAAAAAPATPTGRLEGYRRRLPFWSPRPSRRALSPATTAPPTAARKRDDPPPVSAPPAPTVSDIWEIEEPPAEPFEILEPWGSATSSPTADATSVSSPSGPPNAASDSVWEDAANHGCRLVDAMRTSDQEAGKLYSPAKSSVQSSLMSFDDFTSWGWNANEINAGNLSDFDGGQQKPDPGWGIGHALRELGVSDKIKAQGGKNVIIDALHGKEPFTQGYTKNGKSYPATGAEFKIGINTDDGVLMAMDRISPASAAKKRSPPVSDDQLPDVHAFSDIGYLNYKNILGKDPKNMKYMMSVMITNDKTASIIAKALGGGELGPWPGKSFNWRSKEFKALLGSPNGMGFGYLLVQHKSQLGNLFIKDVQIFHGDTWHKLPNMLFTLEVQNGQDPPPKSSGLPPQMVEPLVTGVPGKLRRGGLAPVMPTMQARGPKNFVRAHIKHVEL